MLFDFALDYAFRSVHEAQESLKLRGTLQLLACAYDVNVVRENVDTVKENAEALPDASKEVGLE